MAFRAQKRCKQARPERAAAIDAVLEVLSVSHTVVSTRDRCGRLKYEAESPDEGALVEAGFLFGLLGLLRGRWEVGLALHWPHQRGPHGGGVGAADLARSLKR